jgi:UDP-GlcNAc:undecaprenyl-phosphate GlcNAc-1-phosphate transferase
MHTGLKPNIGGLAIFLGFLVALLLGCMARPDLIDAYRVPLLAILLGSTLMMVVGFIDDIWEVPAGVRLIMQFIAAGILVINGVKIDFITNYFGQISPFSDLDYIYLGAIGEVVAIVVTLLWVVGFTNAFNFIDGLDGLSSGMALISSLSLLVVAMQFSERGASVLLLASLAGAALGFLRHNFAPSKIIMGDSGAYLIGYVLAAVSVLGALKVTATVTVAAPILMLALPVVNITQVTLRRIARRQSIADASNDHLHDILRTRSGSKNIAVIVLWLVTLVLCVLGLLVSNTPPLLIYATMITVIVLIVVVGTLRVIEVDYEKAIDL